MLQKIFNRSFRRSHKTYDPDKRKNSSQSPIDSDEDEPRKARHTPNGCSGGPPIAKPECSPESEPETEFFKKVTFDEPPVSMSPDTTLDTTVDLFDGSVLKAFQVGDLSIADFLKSPHTSPDINAAKKKHRSLSDFGIQSQISKKPIDLKKQSLLDRAHSMNYKPIRKVSEPVINKTSNHISHTVNESPERNATEAVSEPVFSENPSMENLEQEPSQKETSQKEIVANGETTPKTSIQNEIDSRCREITSRFSTSLETLAQEVFGDEFQAYLSGASKSPCKFSLSKTAAEVTSDGRVVCEEPENSRKLHVAPKPLRQNKKDSLQTVNEIGKSKHLGILASSHSFSVQEEFPQKAKLKKDSSNCISLDIPSLEKVARKLEPNLESWNNNTNLSVYSINGSMDGTEVVAKMTPIVEDAMTSPKYPNYYKSNNSVSDSPQRRKSAGSPGIVPISNQFEFVYRRKLGRLSTTDSEYVNIGSSFNDGDGRGLSSSEIDFQFPPPPPVEEEFITPSIDNIVDAQPAMCRLSFEDTRYSSPEFQLDFTNDIDPLVESLMSIVPLPDNRNELVPALSKALSEIVSEIIASRMKLKRMMKAIEIHQQVLKDQNRQIQKQTKEIDELRKTAYALNNYQIDHPREQSSNSPRTVTDRANNRQSREMVELNLTLDKLLYQCSALQKTPREGGSEQTDQELDDSDSLSLSPSVRRVKSFPSRKLKYSKATVVEDETPND